MRFKQGLAGGTAMMAIMMSASALAQPAPAAGTTAPLSPAQAAANQPSATTAAPGAAQASTAQGASADVQTAPPDTPAADSSRDLGDIVVTARRREESIQKVPVSVVAFNSEALLKNNITNTQSLQRITPGVVFTGAGTESNTTLAIRGQGRGVVGPGLPSVITYFNEVPLGSYGSVLPTYDISNVQILKGPQGTLFGRNTTGGALLVYSAAPTYDFGGYVQGTAGDYFWHAAEGALNIPIISDKVALRIAGKYEKRDGYTRVLNGGRDQDDLNSRSYRASLLVQPTSWLKNVTVGDYYHKNTGNAGVQAVAVSSANPLYNQGSAVFGPALGPLINAYFNCNTSPACDADLAIQAQIANGPRVSNIDAPHFDDTTIWGISNTTTANIGSLTFKNIFGYRHTHYNQANDTDGTSLVILDTLSTHDDHQISDEVQFSGALFNDKLTYIFGAFYLNSTPEKAGTGLRLDFLRPPIIPQTTPLIGTASASLYSDQSIAGFGSLSYELFSGVKINGGYRYTRDREGICSLTTQPITAPLVNGLADCRSRTGPGTYNNSTTFAASTFSAGVDWQITPNVFTYGVVRRGYRAGGLNAPQLGGLLTPYQAYLPQTLTDVEIGAKLNFSAGDLRGRFNIAAYRGTFKNLQRQLTAIPPNLDGDNNPLDDPASTSLQINGARSRVQGIEADAVVSPFQALTLTAGFSYLDPKYTSVSTPAIFSNIPGGLLAFDNAPKWSYTGAARYKLPFELGGARFFGNGDVYHIDTYTVGLGRVPGYELVNGSLDIENIGNTKLTLSIFVTNVLNKLYYTNSSLSGASPGPLSFSFGEPRIFGARVRYTF